MMSTTQSLKNLVLSITVAGTAASIVLMGADSASALTFQFNANILDSAFSPTPTSVGTVTGTFDYTAGGGYTNIKLFADRFANDVFDREYDSVELSLNPDGLQTWFTSSASTPLLQSLLKLEFASDLGSAQVGDTINLIGGKSLNSFEGFESPLLPGTFISPLAGSVTAVPTPALLPGLVGMGIAALRSKRRDDAEESAEV